MLGVRAPAAVGAGPGRDADQLDLAASGDADVRLPEASGIIGEDDLLRVRHEPQRGVLCEHVGEDDAIGEVDPAQQPAAEGCDGVGFELGQQVDLIAAVTMAEPWPLDAPLAGTEQEELSHLRLWRRRVGPHLHLPELRHHELVLLAAAQEANGASVAGAVKGWEQTQRRWPPCVIIGGGGGGGGTRAVLEVVSRAIFAGFPENNVDE